MVDITIRPARPEDADVLDAELNTDDRRELLAASGPDTLATIHHALKLSDNSWAVEDDSGLVCLFGAVPADMLGLTGVPWMLGTPRLARHKRKLIVVARRYFAQMLRRFHALTNFVDARHAQSLVLLRGIGCTIHPAVPFGVEGLPFHRFEMEREHV